MKKQFFTAALLSIALTQAAQAAPIVFNWQGTATRALAQYGVGIGAMVSGTVSYDPATATAFSIYNEGPAGGGIINWKGNPMFVTVDAGSLHEKIDVTSMVANNYYGSIDDYEFYNTSSSLGYFNLQLQDATGKALNSRDLLTTSPDLNAFATKHLIVQGSTFAQISSFSLAGAAVPEPVTLGLFGLGLAAVAFTRRRKQG